MCELSWLEDVGSIGGCGEVDMYVESRGVFWLDHFFSRWFEVVRTSQEAVVWKKRKQLVVRFGHCECD